MKKVLTIAGSDSSGGAGIQADIKSMSANNVYAMSVITAITAQNSVGVQMVRNLDVEIIDSQIESIFNDIEVSYVKVGMVSQIEIIKTIVKKLKSHNVTNVIIDPVMISKSGFYLLEKDAQKVLIDELLPMAKLITPNIEEAEVILNNKIRNVDEMISSAKTLYNNLKCSILIKGGHLDSTNMTDVLYDGNKIYKFNSEKINTKNTHGTGCSLSSAITANLANGCDMYNSILNAKKYVTRAIETSFNVGKGHGPINHFHNLK